MGAALGIERIHWAAWLGIFISVAGLYVVITANGSGLRWATVRAIATGWVLTLPAAALLSGSLFFLFHLIH